MATPCCPAARTAQCASSTCGRGLPCTALALHGAGRPCPRSPCTRASRTPRLRPAAGPCRRWTSGRCAAGRHAVAKQGKLAAGQRCPDSRQRAGRLQAGGGGVPAVQALEANADEVNSLAVHARGQYLAAGDDAGDIQARPPETRPPDCRACCGWAERTCNTAPGVLTAAVY